MSNSIIDFLLDGIVDVTLVIIAIHLIYYHTAHPVTGLFDFQAPVVQTSDSAIHRINHYPADSVIDFCNTYPLDSDLSVG